MMKQQNTQTRWSAGDSALCCFISSQVRSSAGQQIGENKMKVNEALSKFYGQPVVGGYTNAGWPVVRPANNLDSVVAGGLGGEVPPAVESLLRSQAALLEAAEEFDRETDAATEARERAAEIAAGGSGWEEPG
jgi:hypothetical protein